MNWLILLVAVFSALANAETVTVTSTRNYRLPTTTAQTDGTVYVTSTRQVDVTSLSSLRSSSPSSQASIQTTAVTDCHFHDSVQFCINGYGVEGSIVPAPTNADAAPTSYDSCHSHDDETFCMYQGNEVQFVSLDEELETSTSSSGRNCHFHAGVEHCVGGDEHESSCERVDRDYNIPLRIGLLFVILVTSAIGSFGPIALKSLFKLSQEGYIITIIKQFGTGIIISTAFVHLMTHAHLMWTNTCLHIEYEGTGAAITMAGILIAFMLEYLAHRLLGNRSNTDKIQSEKAIDDSSSGGEDIQHGISVNDKISVMILEAGILFHSILIGIILVVAGDTYFITLFIVIVFHQFFEGLALGSRIISIDNATMLTKLSMALAFALITPIGMAIGIGVLNKFNGNDPATIIALGTLDSFSAGVLLWTGLVEMWSHDWLHGYLGNAPFFKTFVGFASLITGMLLMSLLGNWA
ncbi:IRT1 Fe(2+) transport protein 1 [Candida maltosa Xu316]|uniref:Uncharacterized protein n=1 Tax=Candida maltosa (strain Xu316) TaxID=1245528 RepID=M3JSP3_CANMX|nr:hypothetical protein G210_3964 [Candida maltosa Xu316]